MRAILSKAVVVSMIAGAGLLVTACGGGETPANVTNVTEELPVENVGTSDNMTLTTDIDGANATVEANTVEANATVGNTM